MVNPIVGKRMKLGEAQKCIMVGMLFNDVLTVFSMTHSASYVRSKCRACHAINTLTGLNLVMLDWKRALVGAVGTQTSKNIRI